MGKPHFVFHLQDLRQFLAIMKNVAMNICMHFCGCMFLFLFDPRNGIDRLYGKFLFDILRNY